MGFFDRLLISDTERSMLKDIVEENIENEERCKMGFFERLLMGGVERAVARANNYVDLEKKSNESTLDNDIERCEREVGLNYKKAQLDMKVSFVEMANCQDYKEYVRLAKKNSECFGMYTKIPRYAQRVMIKLIKEEMDKYSSKDMTKYGHELFEDIRFMFNI